MSTEATVHIRAAAPGDEDALSLVGQATFLETFAGLLDGNDILAHCRGQHASSVYASWLASADVRLWLAEARSLGAPVGYSVLHASTLTVPDPQPGELELK